VNRIQVFEREDFKWFPSTWRDYGTNYLQFIATRLDIYKSIFPPIEKGLDANEKPTWLDCASVGSGGLVNLLKGVVTMRSNVTLKLSDLYPNT
jgi:hypothetical protein